MNWLYSLFTEHTPLQAVIVLSVIIAVGLGFGKIKVFGVSLGVTFVFFITRVRDKNSAQKDETAA